MRFEIEDEDEQDNIQHTQYNTPCRTKLKNKNKWIDR